MSRTPLSRKARKRSRDVTELLRQRILTAHWKPGSRIPRKVDLCAELGASDGTVQKALAKLKKHGFLRPRGRLGTFVVERPPHLHRIGLVTGIPAGQSSWLDTLYAVADRLTRDGLHWLQGYFDCRREGDALSPGLRALEDDVEHGLLAGLIFACDPDALAGTRAATLPRLARVGITGSPQVPAWPAMRSRPPYPRAMERFRELRRRRLAVIATYHYRGAAMESLLECARAAGLRVRPLCVHYFHEQAPHAAQGVADLLMHLPRATRPDALYVNDDHLVRWATAGLADSGVRIPRDLTVIAHANFPAPPPAAVPVTWLGYDWEAALRTALSLLDRQMAGETVPQLTWLDPVFGGA